MCDRSYMADVRAIRGFRDRHDHVMGTVLHQLEQVEINRLNGVAASMRHYMVDIFVFLMGMCVFDCV